MTPGKEATVKPTYQLGNRGKMGPFLLGPTICHSIPWLPLISLLSAELLAREGFTHLEDRSCPIA